MSDEALPVVLRRYESPSYRTALDAYAADLLVMARGGYFPVATTWGWDSEGATAEWLLGGSSWKPGPGTLAVTYRRDGASAGDR
jgi:hypothetical protein